MNNPRASSFAKNASITSRTQKSFHTSRPSPGVNSGRRSLFGTSVSRNNSILNASLQTTQLIEDTGTHVLENFGIPLPVLVTEALTLVERSRDASACLNPNGYAWLVCGRRLFVWKYKLPSHQRLSSAPQCRELTLPYSDLAHKANLVCVLANDENQIPAAVVVSPEGTIRYWPNIAHEGSSIELSVELHGQECYSLTNCQPLGCVIATTTCTLILVSPSDSGRENSLVCRNLTTAKGVLARLGRRMSSFIFGSIPNQATESRLVRVLVSNDDDSKAKLLFILSGSNLQKWEIEEDEGDRLIFDYDIESFAREKFVDCLWGREMVHPHQLKVWLIDMQINNHGLFILTSAVSPREPQRIRYALGMVDVSKGSTTAGFQGFIVLSHSDTFQDEEEDIMLNYCLLLPDSKLDCAYIYRKTIVLCVPLSGGSEGTDKVELRQPGDHILGAGSYDGLPLFFSHNYGIVSISLSSQDDSISVVNTSVAADTPSVSISESFSMSCGYNQLDDLVGSDDNMAQLKAALLLYCRKNVTQSRAIVDDLFPPVLSGPTLEVDSTLDSMVLRLSRQTIDDFPATDPRWAEAVQHDSGMTTSLLILHQLEDKQKAHRLLLAFIVNSGLWEKLQVTSLAGHLISTRRLLCEHAEKLIVAKALRELHSQYSKLLESAIKIALATRKVSPSSKLTNQDLFYREVSRIQDVIPALQEVEQNIIDDGNTQTIVSTLEGVNCILLTTLRQVSQYQQSQTTDTNLEPTPADGEFLPWITSSDGATLRLLLIKQHRLTLNHAVKAAQDLSTSSSLFQQLMDLTDQILDGYRSQLKSLSSLKVDPVHLGTLTRQYETERSKLIFSLVELQQHERAMSLAEKYLDLELLVRICDITDNQERLQRYTVQFAEQNFSEFVFNWYIREGKRGKLLSQPALPQEKLQQFLQNHQNISWLQDIRQNRYSQAHGTLQALSSEETEVLSRKKHMLSLSKLCLLASDLPESTITSKIKDISHEQNLIIYQETLPASVLEHYGYDVDNMKVLSPADLIQMYVCKENVSANEHDFHKALDLLKYIYERTPDEYRQWHTHIWCQALLRDNWDDFAPVDEPLEACCNTILFKTIDLVVSSGHDLIYILPNIDDLLASEELSSVASNPTTCFLVKAGYEQFMRLIE